MKLTIKKDKHGIVYLSTDSGNWLDKIKEHACYLGGYSEILPSNEQLFISEQIDKFLNQFKNE